MHPLIPFRPGRYAVCLCGRKSKSGTWTSGEPAACDIGVTCRRTASATSVRRLERNCRSIAFCWRSSLRLIEPAWCNQATASSSYNWEVFLLFQSTEISNICDFQQHNFAYGHTSVNFIGFAGTPGNSKRCFELLVLEQKWRWLKLQHRPSFECWDPRVRTFIYAFMYVVLFVLFVWSCCGVVCR